MHGHEPGGGLPSPPTRPQRHTHAYHEPGGRLPLLSARPTVTFPAVGRHRLYASTNLYCLVTEAHRCEKLGQGFYAACPAESRIHDLLIASPTLYHNATTQFNIDPDSYLEFESWEKVLLTGLEEWRLKGFELLSHYRI